MNRHAPIARRRNRSFLGPNIGQRSVNLSPFKTTKPVCSALPRTAIDENRPCFIPSIFGTSAAVIGQVKIVRDDGEPKTRPAMRCIFGRPVTVGLTTTLHSRQMHEMRWHGAFDPRSNWCEVIIKQ